MPDQDHEDQQQLDDVAGEEQHRVRVGVEPQDIAHNHLVGILHGCLKTRTRYDETTAWAHRTATAA